MKMASRDPSCPELHQNARVIEFERQVLEEARNERNPLLERVKFLGILGGNLDERMMVHGRAWAERLGMKTVARRTHALLRHGYRVLQRELLPALANAGLHLVDYPSLTSGERADVDRRFADTALPFITPMSGDQLSPATIQGLGLNLAVVFDDGSEARRLAIVRVPDELSPLVSVAARREPACLAEAAERCRRGSANEAFVWLHQVIAANAHRLFPGARIRSTHAFRIIRDADIALDSGDAEQLPGRTIDAVRQRDTNPVVMLVIDRGAAPALVDRLVRALDVAPEAVVRARHVVDFKRLWDVAQMPRADLRYPALMPAIPARVGPCLFAAICRHDILLHHPFESFQPVIDLVRQAAIDPAVERISATLYRTDRGESPLLEALVDAARRGKDVRVVVELKARFDERRNAEWSLTLKAAGARVIHAPARLKVHAKMLLVERRESSRLRRYVHVSSGNYSAFTSTVYTDLGLMTCDDTVAGDVAELFDFIAGDVPVPRLRGAIAAPFGLRTGFRALVEREIAWAERGEAAHIILKMNALLDSAAIDLLQRAARAGVQVDLIVRGASALVPFERRGLSGSTNIRIRSIVGRFLEHSRAWYFRNGGAEELFIGSADLRPRNFDKRVEIMVPLRDRALAHRLRYEILDLYLLDTTSARELLPNGRYRRVMPRAGEPAIACQGEFLDLQCSSGDARTDGRDHNRASHRPGGHAGARAIGLLHTVLEREA
jgi:polyphosphate kinase